jgi:hypothetical protein
MMQTNRKMSIMNYTPKRMKYTAYYNTHLPSLYNTQRFMLFIYDLTRWSRIVLDKLIVVQVVKKCTTLLPCS